MPVVSINGFEAYLSVCWGNPELCPCQILISVSKMVLPEAIPFQVDIQSHKSTPQVSHSSADTVLKPCIE